MYSLRVSTPQWKILGVHLMVLMSLSDPNLLPCKCHTLITQSVNNTTDKYFDIFIPI